MEATEEDQERKRKEKLTERLMDKLANLPVTKHNSLDAGKGTSQSPEPITPGTSSQKRDLGSIDKKEYQVQEPSSELEKKEPELATRRLEGKPAQREKETIRIEEKSTKAKEKEKEMKEDKENMTNVQETTNTEMHAKNSGGRKWKRHTKESNPAIDTLTVGGTQHYKRKNGIKIVDDGQVVEMQAKEMARKSLATTAKATEQPCQAQ
ncbi:hypothetical protein PIB30_056818 [Stylosanthes scabra]|uniref:Uncharacterized protein n=1 Tax=Stylosanthes scabra TaxID=79078 RepID=A0ABU6UIY8_9FABA|nr:hypothetical protein [Stylosanthes scabra]